MQQAEINRIIDEIIFLPERFHLENKSILTLLKETGYFEHFDSVNETDISERLAIYPRCIEKWMILSLDNRTGQGWGISDDESGKYSVWYYPPQEDLPLIEFDNIQKACATFIKLEIESIRKIKYG